MPTANQQQINEYYFGVPQCESGRYRHWFASDERKARLDHRKMMAEKWAALTPERKEQLRQDERNWNNNRFTDI